MIKQILKILLSFTISFTLATFSCLAVTWEEQAERLQKVSATLLDGTPVNEPPRAAWNIGLKTVISVLPKVDNQVGSKNEKTPSAPVHSVPIIDFNLRLFEASSTKIYLRTWAGALVPGAENIIGLDAELSQTLFGGMLFLRTKMLYFFAGFQKTSAELKGPIASTEADDSFEMDSQLTMFGMGLRKSRYWASLTGGTKVTASTFTIVEDQTSLEFTDKLEDSGGIFYQLCLGMYISKRVPIGVAQIVVPKRLTMSRIFIGYEFF